MTTKIRSNENQAVGGITVDIISPSKWKHPYFADREWAQLCMDAWVSAAEERGLLVSKIECGDSFVHALVEFPAYTTATVSNYISSAKKASKAAIRDRFGAKALGKTAGSLFARTYMAVSVGRAVTDRQIESYLDDVRTQYKDKPYG